MFRYLDEQTFRYNKREYTDLERMIAIMRTVADKRVTYKELTGKTQPPLPKPEPRKLRGFPMGPF